MDLYWFFVEYYITLFVKWCSTLHFKYRVVQKHQLLRFLAVTFIFASRWNFQSRIWQWDMLLKKVTKYNIKINPPPAAKNPQTNKQTKNTNESQQKKHKNNITLKPSRLQTGKWYITQFTAIYWAAQWCNDWQETPPAATSLFPWICVLSLCMGFPWILQFPLTVTA